MRQDCSSCKMYQTNKDTIQYIKDTIQYKAYLMVNKHLNTNDKATNDAKHQLQWVQLTGTQGVCLTCPFSRGLQVKLFQKVYFCELLWPDPTFYSTSVKLLLSPKQQYQSSQQWDTNERCNCHTQTFQHRLTNTNISVLKQYNKI